MQEETSRVALLENLYQQYLVDHDSTRFIARVRRRYLPGALERLAESGSRLARRAAVLALGIVGNFESNHVLGRALHDDDRGVRTLAENSLRSVWCRAGTHDQQDALSAVIQHNNERRYDHAIRAAEELIETAPWFAEAWNQRAIAYCGTGRLAEAIHDCHQALEINPYHFGAAAGMGHCYLQLGNRAAALECFRRALRLNPGLEGIRAQISSLERASRQD